MAAVMASDSQILALSTMFTADFFAFYGGKRRFGEAVQVPTGRLFIVLITIVAYLVALRAPETIFELAIQYAFSGFASLSPLLIAALFWRGSTKWGALASTIWTAVAVVAVAIFQHTVPAPALVQRSFAWSAAVWSSHANARRHRGFWFHAGSSDGDYLCIVDDYCIANDKQASANNTYEVLPIMMRMKHHTFSLIAALVVSCWCAPAPGQTRKPAKAKTSQATARQVIKTAKAPQSNSPLSQAIVAGDLVFTSGQLGIDPKTGQMVAGGIEEQTEQVLLNLATVLEAAGSSPELVLKTTVFLTNMDDFSAMNTVYRRHFKQDFPARSTVQVARGGECPYRIEAIALVKKD